MAVPENASLYPFFTLTKGQQVRFTALDPTDGSTVAGVVISQMVLGVESSASGGSLIEQPASVELLPGASA